MPGCVVFNYEFLFKPSIDGSNACFCLFFAPLRSNTLYIQQNLNSKFNKARLAHYLIVSVGFYNNHKRHLFVNNFHYMSKLHSLRQRSTYNCVNNSKLVILN